MGIDLEMFRRFRRETLGVLATDLEGWAVQALSARLSAADRRRERDRLLREAAELLPPWRDPARVLHAEMLALRGVLPSRPDPGTISGLLAEVLLLCGGQVPSLKTIQRVFD